MAKDDAGVGLSGGDAYPAMGKGGLQLSTIDDCYLGLGKAEASARAGDDAPQAPPKKIPRDMSPTTRMKPSSDEDAMNRLRKVRRTSKKSIRWLTALKSASRGGALPLLGPNGRPGKGSRSANRKYRGVFGTDGRHGPRSRKASFRPSRTKLRRAMEAMSAPTGSAKPPKVYLPGVHNPKSPVRQPAGLKRPSSKKPGASTTPSAKPPALKLGESVPTFKKGSLMTTRTNFDDLFKSELAPDDHLVDCPHCDAPITKSDLAKSHKGKVTHQSGARRGKSSAHVVDHNPEGGTMRGGDGHGVHTSSRGVPGAKKTDEVRVQSTSKHRGALPGVSKADEVEDDVEAGDEPTNEPANDPAAGAQVQSPPMKKSITIRGTDFVQYVDDGSDAALAKAISEGALGGTPPTRPLDLNNDLTRLLI